MVKKLLNPRTVTFCNYFTHMHPELSSVRASHCPDYWSNNVVVLERPVSRGVITARVYIDYIGNKMHVEVTATSLSWTSRTYHPKGMADLLRRLRQQSVIL